MANRWAELGRIEDLLRRGLVAVEEAHQLRALAREQCLRSQELIAATRRIGRISPTELRALYALSGDRDA